MLDNLLFGEPQEETPIDMFANPDDQFIGTDQAADVFTGLDNAQYQWDTRQQHSLDPGFAAQFGAGVDLGQALLYRGAQGIAEATGLFSAEQWEENTFLRELSANADRNEAEANAVNARAMYEDGTVKIGGVGDQLARGLGTAAVGIPAMFAGIFGAKAAVAGAAITSGVMGVGDIALKAEELDADYVTSLSDAGLGLALGTFEGMIGGKFLKALDGVASDVASPLAKSLGMAGSAAVQTGVGEGIQDFTTSVKAHTSTDTWGEADVKDLIMEAGQEAIIGGLLGAPMGVSQSVIDTAAKKELQRFEDMFTGNMIPLTDEVTGDPVLDQDGQAVMTREVKNYDELYKEPGLWNRAYSMVLGGPTAKIMASDLGKLESAAMLTGHYHQNTGDFARVKHGINTYRPAQEKFKGKEGIGKWAEWRNLSDKELKNVYEAKSTQDQEIIDNLSETERKTYDALVEATSVEGVRKMAKDVGIEFTGLGADYFPLFGLIKHKELVSEKGQAQFRKDMQQYIDDPKYNITQEYLDEGLRLLSNRRELGYGVAETFVESVEQRAEIFMQKENKKRAGEGEAAMSLQEAQLEVMKKKVVGTKGERARVNRTNPMEIERVFAALPQEAWSQGNNGKGWIGSDYRGALESWVDMNAERLGHAETFGANNEKFNEMVYNIMEEAQEKGVTITSNDMKNITQMHNLSQRIPTHQITFNPNLMKPLHKYFGGKWTPEFTLTDLQDSISTGLNTLLLPLSLLPSLPEVFVVSEKGGGGNTIKTALGHLMPSIMKNHMPKNIDPMQLSEMIDNLGYGMHEMKNTAAARFQDGISRAQFEEMMFKFTGTPQFTEMMRMLSATTAERMVISDVGKLLEADATKMRTMKQNDIRQKLLELGLNPDRAMNEFKKARAQGNMMEHLVGSDWYKNQFRVAVSNFVEDTVVHPHPVQKPAWMSDERFKLLAQLKSFMVVFTNQVMGSWSNRLFRDGLSFNTMKEAASILPAVVTMIGAQSMMAALRELAKTGDIDKWEDNDAIDHIVNGIAYIGGLSFAIDPFRASSMGIDPTTIFLGPAAGKLNDAVTGVSSILSGQTSPEDVAGNIISNAARNFPVISALTKDL